MTIVLDQVIRNSKNIGGAAVVLFQSNRFDVWVVFLKIKDVYSGRHLAIHRWTGPDHR